MKNHLKKFVKLDYVANILVLSIVVAVVCLSAMSYIRQYVHQGHPAGLTSVFEDIKWSINGRTLVLVLSTNCHFCQDSAKFHRELARYCAEHRITTLAVFPE